MKNSRNVVVATLLIVLATMAVAYSAFATQVTINGTAEIVGQWNVGITNVEIQNISSGCDGGTPEYTDTDVKFYAKLQKPGDSITYAITIENLGTIDATLNDVIFTADEDTGSPAISFSTTSLANTLNAGEQTTFTVTIKYDEKTTEVPSIKTKTITGKIEYIQK